MHASSHENLQKCLEKYGPLAHDDRQLLTVIDIGSADVNGSYRSLFQPRSYNYVGVDLQPGPGVDIVATDPYHLPLSSECADFVVCGQMLEHCEFFWIAFQDMMRLLKREGLLFLIAPSSGPIHRHPVDCYRFYPDSFRVLEKLAECRLLDMWLDDRGPWRDLVGVFCREQSTVRPCAGPRKVPVPPPQHIARTPSINPAEEVVRGVLERAVALQAIHEALHPDLYLEIGVRHGHSLSFAMGRAVGVDPWPEIGTTLNESVRLFNETSDWFFELHAAEALAGMVDLAFIDGMHLFEFALRDFINTEKHSHPGTVVVFDDVFPNHIAQATRDRRTRVWTGDVWKVIPCLLQYRPDLLLLPIDANPTGLLVVLGLNRSNTGLRDNYNSIVRAFTAGPVTPGEDVLSRQNAISSLDVTAIELLRRVRWARADADPASSIRRHLDWWRVNHTPVQNLA